MTEVETLLANELYRASVVHRMEEWRRGECPIPSVYIDLHEKAAKADIERLMRETGCKFVAHAIYTFGNKDPHMKFLRVIADHESGRLMDFRWSDGNGGGWHWHIGGGIRRNEPPMEKRVGYL